jgi:mannan endo-1,4-beta-mannosidase
MAASFSAVAAADNIKLEAENATLNGSARVVTNRAGYSGTGFVEGFDNSNDNSITFTFEASAGLYDLTIRYTTPSGEKGYVLEVNSESSEGMFPANTSFASANAGKFYLEEGENTIKIGGGWGWYGIDYISLTPTTATLPVKPPKQLVDADATASTKNLFSYMVDLHGTKVLAAQQEAYGADIKEIEYVRQYSGKEPAIGAYDLIEYSPSRIEHGANQYNLSEKAIAWANKDQGRGIISLMWHWNAPTDLINQGPDKHWYSGFYTKATTFNLQAALAGKNSEQYNLLIRDIDAIAVELKKFQEADIPVLWRPLHEAAGAWFWWGAKGAAPFQDLWRIMHDRLTNHHQLHNLIWVYTAERGKPEWYPGNAYVDIVGTDIYENTPVASNLSGAWTELQEEYGGRKLISLSETGNLPNPEYTRVFGTWWSWFTVWNGNDHLRKQSPELIHTVFNDEDVITLDELADWRNYETVTANPLEENIPVLTVHPNPATGNYLNIRLYIKSSERITFSLISTTAAKAIHITKHLKVGANQVALPIEKVPDGLYVLTIKKEKELLTRKVIIRR